jgi:hypothetical protein
MIVDCLSEQCRLCQSERKNLLQQRDFVRVISTASTSTVDRTSRRREQGLLSSSLQTVAAQILDTTTHPKSILQVVQPRQRSTAGTVLLTGE